MYFSNVFLLLSTLFVVTSVAAAVAQPVTSLGKLAKKDTIAPGSDGHDTARLPHISNTCAVTKRDPNPQD